MEGGVEVLLGRLTQVVNIFNKNRLFAFYHFFYSKSTFQSYTCSTYLPTHPSSVGPDWCDLLDFGQLFKAFGNN